MRELKFRAWDTINKEMEFQLFDIYIFFEVIKEATLHPRQLRLMQYTGLKDKNGTEIYEGDIVKRYDDKVYVIEFNDGAFDCEHEMFRHKPWTFEVIGNIYENPELLEI